MNDLTIGILGLQGSVEEHVRSVGRAFETMDLSGTVIVTKEPQEIALIDGLIVPGGESTVQAALSAHNGTLSSIRNRVQDGMAVMGTCAGVIMLAKNVIDRTIGKTNQTVLGVLDVGAERNSFGPQKESFEADLQMPVLGERSFRGVFIRAPTIKSVGKQVDVLSRLDGQIVAVREGNVLGLTFHPELVEDSRIHEHFINMIEAQNPQQSR